MSSSVNFPKCAVFAGVFCSPRMKRYGKLERQLRENWVWFPEVGPISRMDFVGRISGGEWSNKRTDNITETVEKAMYIYVFSIFMYTYIQLNCIV